MRCCFAKVPPHRRTACVSPARRTRASERLRSARCDPLPRSCRAASRGSCPFLAPACVWLRRRAEASRLRLPPGTSPPAAHCHRRRPAPAASDHLEPVSAGCRRQLRCRRRPALARCWLSPAYHRPSRRSRSKARADAAAHRSAGCPALGCWKSAEGRRTQTCCREGGRAPCRRELERRARNWPVLLSAMPPAR